MYCVVQELTELLLTPSWYTSICGFVLGIVVGCFFHYIFWDLCVKWEVKRGGWQFVLLPTAIGTLMGFELGWLGIIMFIASMTLWGTNRTSREGLDKWTT